MTYSYDPSLIGTNGKDKMRFELGDTVVDMAGVSAALCDEEYNAILAQYPSNWRRAKFEALQAIVMKLSYEVDTSVGGLSYSLAQRYDRWKVMLDEEKGVMASVAGLPRAGDPKSMEGPTYFHNDMQANLRKLQPRGRFGKGWC